MTLKTIYGITAVVAIIFISSNNAFASHSILSETESIEKSHEEHLREEERGLADEINIVFGNEALDEQLPQKTTRRRISRMERKWHPHRNTRQSSYTSNIYPNSIQPSLYGGLYDAYGPPPQRNQARNYISYPGQLSINPYDQFINQPNIPLPQQYLPQPQQILPPQPTTVNNYFIAFQIPSDQWRAGNPWFSIPFFFPPSCPNLQPTEKPTTAEPEPTQDMSTGQDTNKNGTSLDDRTGQIWGTENSIDQENKPTYKPFASPIDLTPAKPKRPLSRPAPSADHSASTNRRPATSTSSQHRTTTSRTRPSANRISGTTKIHSSTASPFVDRVSTTLSYQSNDNSDPPSRCINAIVSCCRSNAISYSQSCFESLGCEGQFWDGNPCSSDVARAALNIYNIFRDRFRRS